MLVLINSKYYHYHATDLRGPQMALSSTPGYWYQELFGWVINEPWDDCRLLLWFLAWELLMAQWLLPPSRCSNRQFVLEPVTNLQRN